MTIGIYKLIFNNTNMVYIGQSTNIERRYNSHIHNMIHNMASIKLQKAYTLYGTPILEIIHKCSIHELDLLEFNTINILDSINKGFNTVKGGDSVRIGECNPQALYSIDDYKEILFYLVETQLSNEEIANITETSINVVKHISDMSRHSWLEEESPELYNKLKILRSQGTKKCAIAKGIVYPDIKSPDGTMYTVTNITKFAKEHGLSSGPLSALLNKKARSTNGWCLAEDTLPKPIKVISPDGVVFDIGYRQAKPFALSNGLHPGDFAKVLKGIAGHSKGWKLYKVDA